MRINTQVMLKCPQDKSETIKDSMKHFEKSIHFYVFTPLAFFLLIIFIALQFYVRTSTASNIEQALISKTELVKSSLTINDTDLNSKISIGNLINAIDLDRNINSIYVLDENGNTQNYFPIQDFESKQFRPPLLRGSEIQMLLASLHQSGRVQISYNFSGKVAYSVFAMNNSSHQESASLTPVNLIIDYDLTKLLELNQQKQTSIYLAFLIFVFLSFSFVYVILEFFFLKQLNSLQGIIQSSGKFSDVKNYRKDLGKLNIREFKKIGHIYLEQYQNFMHLNNKLKIASDSKQLFLAHMSHEIRTPLNSILGVSEMLNETNLDESQRQLINVINRSGNSLLETINDILDLSKIEAGKLSIIDTEFSLNVLMEDIVSMFNPIAEQKNIILKYDKLFNEDIFVSTDRLRLQQVIVNLVNNAIKFTDKGSVIIKVIEDEKNPEFFKIKIVDTGIGMNSDQLFRLFRPFEQTDHTITKKYGGNGLSLVICQKIIDLLNGNIHVDSRVGHGTTFIVQLKLKVTKREPISEESLYETSNIPNIKLNDPILIVDDNEINRLIAKNYLTKFSDKIIEANDGNEAFLAFTTKRPYLIFMDIQLPNTNGLASVKLIRDYENANRLRPSIIIALSGLDRPEEKELALQNGFNYYLTKPLKKRTLFKLIYTIDLMK